MHTGTIMSAVPEKRNRDEPDIWPFYISGIWPDTGFELPDIRPDTEKTGYPANWKK
jgi:hypothetical protein